jgi:hypothetical protein
MSIPPQLQRLHQVLRFVEPIVTDEFESLLFAIEPARHCICNSCCVLLELTAVPAIFVAAIAAEAFNVSIYKSSIKNHS